LKRRPAGRFSSGRANPAFFRGISKKSGNPSAE
jgi:hypothetical protein